MKKNSIQGKLVIFIEQYIAWFFLICLRLCLRYRISGNPYKGQRVVYVLWHQNILSVLLTRIYEKVGIVVSASFDGELIAAPAELLGYRAIRGSSSKNSVSALKEMLQFIKTNSVAVTPDGPKGPPYKIKEGAVFLAYMAKLPIIPVIVHTRRKWQFNSWDRFILPKPFSLTEIHYMDPVYITSKDEIASKCVEIEDMMIKAHEKMFRKMTK